MGGAKRKRKGGGGGGATKKSRGDKDLEAGAVAEGIERDAAEKKTEAEEQARVHAQAVEDAAEAADKALAEGDTLQVDTDPYLLADAKYIQKDTRWNNKQRTLVFCSRGVTSRFRHLSEDIKRLLPHHKVEPKFDKNADIKDINEIAELKSCNNVVFFESRKKQDLYLWMARVPTGPTVKFQVLNLHTTKEVRLAGNALLGSRPILSFDNNFDNISYLQMLKTLFTQVLGTPRNHPKSKPFHDHVLSFYFLDKKIWFRHYQISPELPEHANDPEKQNLVEIGPRFVLDPIRILSGSFGGPVIYMNPFYSSPTALRVQAKKFLSHAYRHKLEAKADRKARQEDNREEEDPLDEAFV
eukprot:gnl/TRDRNA2_/TRDRNA2_183270_c0_seq1.p1 gnl/TRDRNA2_/TRDRNA2_183270_c0~~gnl/TRDRNA2_/TRDRNA2_183270_c0_seq1.p1  ORF type:complete len:372 (-),score=83.30 gnl/TRDRNA2_/TRDRNA2_183270_c0_seq1:139-1203(-)